MISTPTQALLTRRIRAVEALADYAREVASIQAVRDCLDVAAISDIDEQLLAYLETSQGRSDVLVWATKFQGSLLDLANFRVSLQRSDRGVLASDLDAADRVVSTMIESLVEWLRSSPEFAAA